MNDELERLLLRRLHGELSPDDLAEVEALLEADGALRERADALARSWRSLDVAAPEPVPRDFASEVVRRTREGRPTAVAGLRLAWAGAAAAAVGIVVGSLLTYWAHDDDRSLLLGGPPTLAEGYLDGVARLEEWSLEGER